MPEGLKHRRLPAPSSKAKLERKRKNLWLEEGSQKPIELEKAWNHVGRPSELVWPSGKALGWQAEGPRFDTASALPGLSLQKGCGLWTLSCH